MVLGENGREEGREVKERKPRKVMHQENSIEGHFGSVLQFGFHICFVSTRGQTARVLIFPHLLALAKGCFFQKYKSLVTWLSNCGQLG